jgi:hypothetical protein
MIRAGHKAPLEVSLWETLVLHKRKAPLEEKAGLEVSHRNHLHHRGEGFAFEPIGAPLGLRSTAPLFPPACSSMDFVLMRLNEHLEHEDGKVVFRHACKLGLEGIVSERLEPIGRTAGAVGRALA